MDNPRLVGHIVSVQGFRVKVELLPETRSALRATLDGVQVAIAINAYLTFSLGAGETVIGIITDLEARETFDPNNGDDLNLELMKPRRVASVQLLGTIEHADDEPSFSPGISVLPTLDTPAEIGSPDILRAVFEIPPRRNKPEDYDDKDFDCDLRIGFPTGQARNVVRASYNDLFSRPLAIVGNTGSGKSFSVSSLIQKAMKALDGAAEEPHVFILDINGEYGKAFPTAATAVRLPDRIYLNGEEFCLPLWFMNAEEICAWLSAAEQTQEPVLKDWWAIAKGGDAAAAVNMNALQNAMSALDQLLSELTKIKKKAAGSHCDAVTGHLADTGVDTAAFEVLFQNHRLANDYNTEVMNNQAAIATEAEKLKDAIRNKIVGGSATAEAGVRTADSPLPIGRATLTDAASVRPWIGRRATDRQQPHPPERSDSGQAVRRRGTAPWERRPPAGRQDRPRRADAGRSPASRCDHGRITLMSGTDTTAPMRLRAEPPRVTRLSRKVLAGAGAVALLGIGGALIYALQTRDAGPGGGELYSTENRPTADGLAGLPRDYTGPVLGPALPGDLGRPILDAQNRGQPVVPPTITTPSVDPEEQRRLAEEEAARLSGVFFQSGPRTVASAGTAMPSLAGLGLGQPDGHGSPGPARFR